MIWTILKADLIWMAIMMPISAGVSIGWMYLKRRIQRGTGCETCDFRKRIGAFHKRSRGLQRRPHQKPQFARRVARVHFG